MIVRGEEYRSGISNFFHVGFPMIETAAIIRAKGRILVQQIAGGGRQPDNTLFALPKILTRDGEEPESALLRLLRDSLALDTTIGSLAGQSERADANGSIHQIAYHVTTSGIDEQTLARQNLQWLGEAELDPLEFIAADRSLLKILRVTSPDFYQTSAAAYHAATSSIDPAAFLMPLTRVLPGGATILDVGCGSGRDLLWLKQRGFNPTGFESSSALAGLARDHSGCPVIEGDFFTFAFHTLQVDAIVLIGTLVHLQPQQLPPILQRISKALLPGGFILLSLKEGAGTNTAVDGRTFTLWSVQRLQEIFQDLRLDIVHHTRQESRLRPTDIWLEYLLKKSSAGDHDRPETLLPGDRCR
jgi:SAM-dependent methyltransferase